MADRVGADPDGFRDMGHFRLAMGQKFMQRRVEQADGHRQAGHDLEQFGEILALHRQDFGQGGAPAVGVGGENHLAHGDDPVAFEKHMLGAAETDALGAEVAGGARVGRGFGVGAHAQPAQIVGPAHDGGEIAG